MNRFGIPKSLFQKVNIYEAFETTRSRKHKPSKGMTIYSFTELKIKTLCEQFNLWALENKP